MKLTPRFIRRGWRVSAMENRDDEERVCFRNETDMMNRCNRPVPGLR